MEKKKNLVSEISNMSGISQKDVKAVIAAFPVAIKNQLNENEKLNILGFGTFKKVHNGPVERRNPATGEKFISEEKDVLKFKASPTFSF